MVSLLQQREEFSVSAGKFVIEYFPRPNGLKETVSFLPDPAACPESARIRLIQSVRAFALDGVSDFLDWPTKMQNVNRMKTADFWFVDQDQGALTVTRGSSAVYTLLEIPVGGFNSTTTLTDSGVSQVPGATASWSVTSLPGLGSVTYTVTTGAATPRGRYPILLAAHSGNIMRTVTVSLTVK